MATMHRRKLILAILTLCLPATIGLVLYRSLHKEESRVVQAPPPAASAWKEYRGTTEPAAPPTPEPTKKALPMPTKNEAYQNRGDGLSDVTGEVVNTDSSRRSVIITVTYYFEDGKTLEGGAAVETSVAAGEKRSFTVRTSRNVAGFKDFKVQANAF